jgi:predicted transcriptional regulator
MVIHLTPEQEAKMQQMALQSGRSLGEVVTETAVWLTKFDQNHDASLQRSLDQADRGEFIEEEEMDVRFARMMRSN